ncbi:protein PXR1 [Cucurbita moschata]|uniref:Protein PXR1 n=1 Tax=Cucurbita moschata TaxID=3662 RepID=A0A6J1E7S6_CUCMO|nr:protein PXR1 [Cucurbita moschata]
MAVRLTPNNCRTIFIQFSFNSGLDSTMGGTSEEKHEGKVEKKEKKKDKEKHEEEEDDHGKKKGKDKDKDKEGGEKKEKKKKDPADMKDPLKLRQKLEKLEDKMQALAVKKEEILKLIHEAEQNAAP